MLLWFERVLKLYGKCIVTKKQRGIYLILDNVLIETVLKNAAFEELVFTDLIYDPMLPIEEDIYQYVAPQGLQ